jgi:nucleotide-binding universal stress UspA family protein
MIMGKEQQDMIKKIVVAIDLMADSDQVLEMAGELALKFDADLAVVHVYETVDAMATFSPYLYPGDGTFESFLEEEKRQLREKVDRLRASTNVRVSGCLKADRAIPGILAFSESEGADLLVLGTHRPGRIERAILGSVSDAVVRQSKVPVLVIPPHDKA